MPRTIEQLQRDIAWSKKQTAYAWAKFYEASRIQLVSDIEAYNQIDTLPPETPDFVLEQLKEFHIQLKKKIECPICLDIIEPEKLGISKCGHKYCDACLEKLKITTKKCAICRKKLCK